MDNRRKILFWSLIFAGLISIYGIFNKSIKNELISPLSTIKTEDSLKTVVADVLNNSRGTYAISIKNLKTGETYSQNDRQVFEAGSLYKLWIMAVVLKQIEAGTLTEDQVLSEKIDDLNKKFKIDKDAAELTEGTITMTVADALKQMITISHNYAALLLTEKIGLSTVVNFLAEQGLTESSVGVDGQAPKSTAFDIASFYERLYKGELANSESTAKMINLLKSQQLNDGLPKYLPDQSSIANKTGDIGWFKHDAGIVFTDKGDYVISIMSESDYPLGAQEKIALISQAAYEYFTK